MPNTAPYEVKYWSDTVGLFVWHAEKGRNCIHQNSKIGPRTHFKAPQLNEPTVSLMGATVAGCVLKPDATTAGDGTHRIVSVDTSRAPSAPKVREAAVTVK